MRFPVRLAAAVTAATAAATVTAGGTSIAAPSPSPTTSASPSPSPSPTPSPSAPLSSPATPSQGHPTVVPPPPVRPSPVAKPGPVGNPGPVANPGLNAKDLAAQASALKALAADLHAAQVTLKPLQTTATTATKAWRRTLAQLAVARAEQARADTAAATARAARDAQDAAIGHIAANAYKAGGDVPSWITALNVTNPTDLFTQQATLNQIASREQDQLTQLEQLQKVADGTAHTADVAAARVFALVDQARQTHDAASGAMAAQQQFVHDLITRQARISDAVQKLLATTPAPQRALLLRQLADALRAVDATAADVDASMHAVTALLPVASPRQGLKALAWARKQLGLPYSWGGGNETGPTLGMVNPEGNSAGLTTTGFDCSGLTLFAWAKEGFTLDHYTGYQWFEGRPVARADLRPGDLVFYATDPKDPTTIHHVGIYAGDGRMIDAPHTGAKVRYDNVFSSEYVGAVRP